MTTPFYAPLEGLAHFTGHITLDCQCVMSARMNICPGKLTSFYPSLLPKGLVSCTASPIESHSRVELMHLEFHTGIHGKDPESHNSRPKV